MKVKKRDGTLEEVSFDKIVRRLRSLRSQRPQLDVDCTKIAAKAAVQIYDGISTSELDDLTAEIANAMVTNDPAYGGLAARILMSNLHKKTSPGIVDTFVKMSAVLSPDFLATVHRYGAELEAMVDYARDFSFDYFGARTLLKMYLTTIDGATIERPQHMYLRVALALWGDDLVKVRETYDMLSNKNFIHASPTLFNAGMKRQQLASCFLGGVEEDSIDGIFSALHTCARISKFGGGIGLHVHKVRSKGAPIQGTNGVSDGLVPMLRVLNNVACYVNQGGRRKGSIAVYISPHHPDIMDVLDLKRNQGDEHLRARDLFYAMWIPDLFMRRVEASGVWSFFDPAACPGLDDAWGPAYDALYESYEAAGKYARQVPAQDVWFAILRSQIETGVPYVLFSDSVNAKSNQQNLGTIKSSNLCVEICEYTSPEEVAVCTLGSLSLPAFVRGKKYDFEALHSATKVLARNLDRVIDITYYPVDEARTSNMRHRPVGIGVQGLQDVFFMMGYPFDSPQARALNRDIFETLYHGALEASAELAEAHGPYSSFAGSPAAAGELQFDMWGQAPNARLGLPWAALKSKIRATGLRNSLSVAPMPTASTAQVMGNIEAFEPVTSNVYSRRTLAGDFVVINHHLVRALQARKLWTPEIKDAIVANDGSVQGIYGIPEDIQALFKTAWELSQRVLIDMAADRGAFVCQSQSLNLFVPEPTYRKLSSMHFYAWRRGLKSGCYYLRSHAAARAVQVTVAASEGDSTVRQPSQSDDENRPCEACSG